MPSVLHLQVLTRGTLNAEYCKLCGAAVTNVEVRRRTNKKEIVSVAHSSSGNGEAMWQEWTSADRHRLHQCGT